MRSLGLSIFQLGVVCPTNFALLSIFNQRQIGPRNMPIAAISTICTSRIEDGNNGGGAESNRMSGETATQSTAVTVNNEIDLYKVCFIFYFLHDL